MQTISSIVDNHHKTMKKGEPQLNYCDRAVMVGMDMQTQKPSPGANNIIMDYYYVCDMSIYNILLL